MLKKILIGVAGVLVLFVAVAATRPSAYHVERKLGVAAPADLVFGVLNDLHQFAGVLFFFGSPLEAPDPNMQKTFAGPAAGAGQSYAWSGSKEVPKGKMTIEESVPGRKVGMKLEFVEPMESTATYALTLAGTPTGSLVTWSMDGNHNFIGKAFGLFVDMDHMLGGDIEKGLAQLKTVAEGKQAAIAAAAAAQADAATAAAEEAAKTAAATPVKGKEK
jgi:Polyketide cyclase / dehydrase and lipid transport